MSLAVPVEPHLASAFALAFFFHPDRDRAIGIAGQAVGKLHVAERAQVRRIYYRPSGRRLRGGTVSLRSRTKVSLERAQLLQRLVLHESEAVERELESRAGIASLSDDEIALRFVEHLVRSAWRRNSFYVTVAIGRILYGYETAAVLDLFAAVMQDPERVPEDSYLRHVKRGLLREIEERFGSLLRTQVGTRGEESLVAAPPTPTQRRLVNRCLELLTPWDTHCLVPPDFDATRHTLGSLRFAGADPDDEHAIEVNRMHALIHPTCFSNLASGLRLELPAERLRIPRPLRSSDTGGGDGPAPDRLSPPELGEHDLEGLRSDRPREEARGGDPVSGIVVSVDGRRRITLDAVAGARESCDLGEAAEIIEVTGIGRLGETLLAVHLVRPIPVSREVATVRDDLLVPLGRGRELLVTLTSTPNEVGARRLELTASCREASWVASLRERWRSPAWAGGPRSWKRARAAFALASAASALGLALLVARRQGNEEPAAARPAAAEDAAAGEITRGAAPPALGTTLQTARVLYVDATGVTDAGNAIEPQQLIELLRTELEAGGRFTTTADREAADAALKARIEVEGQPSAQPPRFRLVLELVDERGRVLWSGAQSAPPWPAAVEDQIRDLIERSR